jgi:PAS domain S-box-containing protein
MVGYGMKGPLRILHLEDNQLDGELIKRMLQSAGLVREWVRVETADAFASELDKPQDLILSDFTLPGFDGMSALKVARSKQPDTPFIFLSGTIEEELAVESLKQGATDYVFKSRLSRLAPVVRRAMQATEEREESRRAEEAMRQSEYKYRQLFESLSDAAFLIEPQSGRILDTNKQGEHLLGRTRGEIVGLKQDKIHIPEKFEDCRRSFCKASEEGTTVDYEAEVISGNGNMTPVHIRAAPILLYGRKLMLALYRDITERKQAEERMHEQARLLDLDPDAIIVRDMDDRIQFWNEGATRIYHWTREEVLGKETRQLLYHDLSEFEAAKRVLMERGEWSGELHQVTKDNQEIVVYSRWKVVRNENGQPRSVLLVNTDVTQQAPSRMEMEQHAVSHAPMRM